MISDELLDRLKAVALTGTKQPWDAASALFSACGVVLIEQYGVTEALAVLEMMVNGARDGARDNGVRLPQAPLRVVK